MSILIVLEHDKDFLVVDHLPTDNEVVEGTRYTFGSEKGGVVINRDGRSFFRKSRGPRYDLDLHALYAAHYGIADITLGGSTDGEGSSSIQDGKGVEADQHEGPKRPKGEKPPTNFGGPPRGPKVL